MNYYVWCDGCQSSFRRGKPCGDGGNRFPTIQNLSPPAGAWGFQPSCFPRAHARGQYPTPPAGAWGFGPSRVPRARARGQYPTPPAGACDFGPSRVPRAHARGQYPSPPAGAQSCECIIDWLWRLGRPVRDGIFIANDHLILSRVPLGTPYIEQWLSPVAHCGGSIMREHN